jgi:hypothetical protein
MVKIHQHEPAHAASREGLGCPGPNAAKADNADACRP